MTTTTTMICETTNVCSRKEGLMSSVRNTESGEDCWYAGLNILLVKSKTFFENFNFCSLRWKLRSKGWKAITVTVTSRFLTILLNIPLGEVTLRHYTRDHVAHARTEQQAVKHKPVTFDYGTLHHLTVHDWYSLTPQWTSHVKHTHAIIIYDNTGVVCTA